MELYQMMDEFEGKGEVDFPHWWQSKIINAKSNLVGAKHYLDFEIKEPSIDAMVGVASDEEILDDESMMENIGKDEILAGKLYKLKNHIQPGFYQRIRNLINSGDIENAKFYLDRIQDYGDRKDTEFSKMKDELDSLGEGYYNLEDPDEDAISPDPFTKTESVAKKLAKQLKSK